MATSTELQFLITAKDEASSVVNGLTGSIENNKASLLALGAIAAAAFGAVVSFASQAVAAAQENEKAQAQLGAVLKSTKDVSGLTAEAANKLSEALQKQTTYSHEAVLGVEDMLLTFTKISASTMPDATTAVLNMSTALGEDTQNAAIQLGKALNDPVKGITALHRVGVEFSDDQKAVIKQMVATGDIAGAQKVILNELNTEFGGSAAAAATTYGGKMAQLNNQMNDVNQSIGEALIPVLLQLANVIVPIVEKVGDWIKQHPELTKWIIILAGLVTGLTLGLTLLAGAVLLVNVAMSPINLIILAVVAAIALLVAGAILIITHWTQIKDFFATLWADVKKIFSEAIQAIVDYFKPLTDTIQNIANAMASVGSGIASVASKVGGAVSGAVHAIIPHAQGGTVSPYSTYLVGENGPELFTSSSAGSILPNAQLAGAGGQSININISGAIFSRDAADQLGSIIMQQLRFKTRIGI